MSTEMTSDNGDTKYGDSQQADIPCTSIAGKIWGAVLSVAFPPLSFDVFGQMGGNESTHRITIERLDEESYNIVKVSDDVIRRVQGGSSLNEDEGPVKNGAATAESNSMKSNVMEEVVPLVHPDKSRTETKMADTLEADTARFKSELYYKQKWDRLVEERQRERQQMQKLLKEKTEAIRRSFEEHSAEIGCVDAQENLLQCYRQNKGRSLRCRDVGNDFIQCVAKEKAHFSAVREPC
ncbi:unnamed protein product [Soboliphyme baturini]|uniref:CHCH domain-containing protein n=1 Tax=Soboliphyme baturini TaxID=241478 RepID=A0A183IET8_9BILA|nr:unnamed protein product [Soboliphyme baturini]